MSLSELKAAREALLDPARAEALAPQRARGKMTARERIAALLDEGSVVEYGAFMTPNDTGRMQGVEAPAEGIISCIGTIDGRPVSLYATDFSVLGGSAGMTGAAKMSHMLRFAAQRGYPLIMLHDSGGHRIQEMDGREFAFGAPTSNFFQDQGLLSGWAPQVAAIMGPAWAGVSAQAAFAEFVPIVKGTGSIGIAGAALVRAATRTDIKTEALGGAEVQARNGLVDLIVDDDRACLDSIKRFLSYLPTNASMAPPMRETNDPVDRLIPELQGVLPESRRTVYDVRKVIAPTADDGEIFELRPTYARNIVTAFARIGGRPVGMIANQANHLAGVLDSAACIKAARFASMCDAYGLPLVTFIDCPGLLIGPQAEQQLLARYATKLLMVLSHATVTTVSIVLRKAYGLAYLAMAGGRSFGAEACLIWPSAEVCPMSIEGAVDQAYRKQWESAEDPAARRAELIADHYALATPLRAASGFGIDDIIDPAETRQKIGRVLRVNEGRRALQVPPKRHWIDPV